MSRHRTIVIADNGQRMQVIRPKDPSLAVHLAETSLANRDAALLVRLPGIVEDAAGTYTFVGYLARRAEGQPCIVDEHGKFVGELEAGDSFVTNAEGEEERP